MTSLLFLAAALPTTALLMVLVGRAPTTDGALDIFALRRAARSDASVLAAVVAIAAALPSIVNPAFGCVTASLVIAAGPRLLRARDAGAPRWEASTFATSPFILAVAVAALSALFVPAAPFGSPWWNALVIAATTAASYASAAIVARRGAYLQLPLRAPWPALLPIGLAVLAVPIVVAMATSIRRADADDYWETSAVLSNWNVHEGAGVCKYDLAPGPSFELPRYAPPVDLGCYHSCGNDPYCPSAELRGDPHAAHIVAATTRAIMGGKKDRAFVLTRNDRASTYSAASLSTLIRPSLSWIVLALAGWLAGAFALITRGRYVDVRAASLVTWATSTPLMIAFALGIGR